MAAADLNWAEYISWLDPRIRSVDQYLLADPPADRHSSFVTGLEYANGVHKPTFAAYRMPIFLPVTRAKRGQTLEVWGCVRPADYARQETGRAQVARIELGANAHGPFRTIGAVTITNVHGYFDVRVRFPSSGLVRIAWFYPRGPAIFSRSVQISVA